MADKGERKVDDSFGYESMGKSMRLLMLNNEFPPLGGGTGTVNLALLDRFAHMRGMEIDLITSALGKDDENERFSDTINIIKVPVNNKNIHHSSNRELLVYGVRALFQALRLHRKKRYEYCFAWSAVPAGGVAFAIHWLTGLRYLVRVCGPDIPGFERRYSFMYPILTPIVKAIWRSADIVIAKCLMEAEMIWAIDRSVQVTQIPNGVDASRFRPAETHTYEAPLRLLCVARLIERKGQRYLIEAVKQLLDNGHDVHLNLIGTGDSESEYRTLVESLGITEAVAFSGYIPREEMPQHYANADVFVLPSFNEGMSVATLEAMASGLPLVVTRTGGMDDLVEEGENGFFVDFGDVGGLVAKTSRFSQHRDLIGQMGTASRIRAMSFSWDKVAQTYYDFLLRLQNGASENDRKEPESS